MGNETNAIPISSAIFGYGPMLPFVVAAVGAWTMPAPSPALAIRLAILWGVLILAFVAGVRRGYGFGDAAASTSNEIATMLVYFVAAGCSLLLAFFDKTQVALAVQIVAYVLVAIMDGRAAMAGNAPLHFARLRPPQMSIAVVALASLLTRTL